MSRYLKNIYSVLLLSFKGVRFDRRFSIDINANIKLGTDVSIGRDVILEGDISIGDNVVIENNCLIKDSIIRSGSRIKSYTIVESSEVGEESFIGPFARIRGGSVLGKHCQIGNFVEIKNSIILFGCRINHMAFIGDSNLGKNVTIGAGVITCNHDGEAVQRTVIGERAYIGSNSNLIAPILIGEYATIGSGSTITEDVPAKKLAVARVRQKVIESWKGFNR